MYSILKSNITSLGGAKNTLKYIPTLNQNWESLSLYDMFLILITYKDKFIKSKKKTIAFIYFGNSIIYLLRIKIA